MKGVALSDLHLGFRAFAATENGRNVREQDVERAFAHAVDRIVAYDPDLVTVAGDVFHNLRPSFHAVRAWQRGIGRIVEETAARVVVILGNHEAAKTAETLSPVVVVEDVPRVHVVTMPKRLRLNLASGENVSVASLPFVALAQEETYRLDPDPDADVNVLLVHAAVRSSAIEDDLPRFYAGQTALDVGREAERWDVIAAGDFHDFRRLHPTRLAFYSGAIERTSSNIWPETEPKGVVLYDTQSGHLELTEIPTRPMQDWRLEDFNLFPIGAGPDEVNQALELLVPSDDVAGAIVRLRVDDFPAADRDRIDWKAVRRLKERCTHFQLDLRFSEESAAQGLDRRSHVVPLLEQAARFLADEPEAVRALALSYLEAREAA
jgi:DNA repair exonuclease SbcCD nuclease subunit